MIHVNTLILILKYDFNWNFPKHCVLNTFYDYLMSHTDPRKMVCGIKVIFSIDKIGINGVIYFFFYFCCPEIYKLKYDKM